LEYGEFIFLIKSTPASTTTYSLDMNLLQAFNTIFLSREPITSFIFAIRDPKFLLGALLTCTSQTRHTKYSKGLQSGEQRGQIPFSLTSRRFFRYLLGHCRHLLHGVLQADVLDVHMNFSLSNKLVWRASGSNEIVVLLLQSGHAGVAADHLLHGVLQGDGLVVLVLFMNFSCVKNWSGEPPAAMKSAYFFFSL